MRLGHATLLRLITYYRISIAAGQVNDAWVTLVVGVDFEMCNQ